MLEGAREREEQEDEDECTKGEKGTKGGKNRKEGKKGKMRNIWIVKPGENSNQGRGITVIDEVY